MADDYEVGFGRPPEHGKFKKGQSGNPRGRPKGQLSQAQIVQKVLNERVLVPNNSREVYMTKRELLVRAIVNKAGRGVSAAARIILDLDNGAKDDTIDAEVLKRLNRMFRSKR